MIYLFFGFISTLSTMLYSILNRNKIVNPFFFISFLFLFILGAIRYDVGTDYIFYSNYQIPVFLDGGEVKFEFLSRKIAELGFLLSNQEHYQYIFAIYHFICVFFIFLAIKNQSKILALSILLYILSGFYNFSLNGIRQAMAMSILLYSTQFIFNRKYLKYMILVFISSLFHVSAIIGILFLFLDKKRFEIKSFIVVSCIIYCFFIFFIDYVYGLIRIAGIYSEYIGSQFDSGEFNITITIYGIVSCIIFYLLYSSTKGSFIREITFYMNINQIVFILALIMPFIPNGYRVFYIFLPFHIIIFPNMISFVKNKFYKHVYTFVLLLFYLLFFMKIILISNYGETLPYMIYPKLLY